MTIRSLALALIAGTLAAGVYAQEEPVAEKPRAAAPATVPPQAPAAAAAPPAPREASGEASGDERFVPSEEINEDLSVSFPADI